MYQTFEQLMIDIELVCLAHKQQKEAIRRTFCR